MKENTIHHYLGMVKLYKKHYLCLMLIAVLMGTFSFTTVSCSKDDNAVETSELKGLADRVWEYSLNNPDGFTIDVRNWTVPTEGICVSLKNPLFYPLYNFICKHPYKPCESDFAGLFAPIPSPKAEFLLFILKSVLFLIDFRY